LRNGGGFLTLERIVPGSPWLMDHSPLGTLLCPVRALAIEAEQRVVAEAVEPGADQGVATAQFVVEEGEGQVPVKGLDPERHAGHLHREWVEFLPADALLDDGAAYDRFQPLLDTRGWQAAVGFV